MRHIKVDVTDKIIGKINNEVKLELYYFNEKIGYFESKNKITFTNNNFTHKEGKIIKIIEDVKVSQYVEDCDLGWC